VLHTLKFECELLANRVALLFPRVAVGVIAIALPEAKPVVIQQHKSEHPLHALPRIQMRHDQPQRTAVLRREWLADVFERKEDVRTKQVIARNACRVAFFGPAPKRTLPPLLPSAA
jgi:hypothetical protein